MVLTEDQLRDFEWKNKLLKEHSRPLLSKLEFLTYWEMDKNYKDSVGFIRSPNDMVLLFKCKLPADGMDISDPVKAKKSTFAIAKEDTSVYKRFYQQEAWGGGQDTEAFTAIGDD